MNIKHRTNLQKKEKKNHCPARNPSVFYTWKQHFSKCIEVNSNFARLFLGPATQLALLTSEAGTRRQLYTIDILNTWTPGGQGGTSGTAVWQEARWWWRKGEKGDGGGSGGVGGERRVVVGGSGGNMWMTKEGMGDGEMGGGEDERRGYG